MEIEKFQNKMNSIQEKIGKDASNLILDEIGELLTDNKQMNEQMENKDKEITTLKKTNETLQQVNGNLLQQVAMGEEEKPNVKENKEEKPKYIDYRQAFDEKGNFKN